MGVRALRLALLLALAAPVGAEDVAPKRLDELVLEARTIVTAEVVAEGALEVRTVFRGDARPGVRIRIDPRALPPVFLGEWPGTPPGKGARLLVLFDRHGDLVQSGGAILLHEGRAVWPMQTEVPGPRMLTTWPRPMRESMSEEELIRTLRERMTYLEEVERRLAGEPDPERTLRQLRAANGQPDRSVLQPSYALLDRFGAVLVERGSVEQRYEAFTLKWTAVPALGKSLQSPAGHELLWAGMLDEDLSSDVRSRCIGYLGSVDRVGEMAALIPVLWRNRELGWTLCRTVGRLLRRVEDQDAVVAKLAELHASGPEDMRHAIALSVFENAPAKYAVLRTPCPPFPIRLHCDRRDAKNVFHVHVPRMDPPPKFAGEVKLVLVPLRGGASVELPAPAGVLERGGSVSLEGLDGVDPGRYRAYLRLGPAEDPWSESYGCTVEFP